MKPGDHIITTSMEHNAVARPLFQMSKEGVEWTAVKCEPDGSLDPEELRRAIKPQTRMICVLHASNLTGTVMPVKTIGQIARENGILFMLDTAQTAGVLRIDVEEFKIDILAFTGHKGLLHRTGGIYLRLALISNHQRRRNRLIFRIPGTSGFYAGSLGKRYSQHPRHSGSPVRG